eukprot:TRINITY_DN34129_c0_g1_i1.p1 TRINITY_DN34129_c0_g1~~TRINITY_DN34129_c0_g1_i1.p1  ORF type:complete len:741 (-),score=116.29 TRINITY_DN34129_c0_g1_i1:1100-3322(-)
MTLFFIFEKSCYDQFPAIRDQIHQSTVWSIVECVNDDLVRITVNGAGQTDQLEQHRFPEAFVAASRACETRMSSLSEREMCTSPVIHACAFVSSADAAAGAAAARLRFVVGVVSLPTYAWPGADHMLVMNPADVSFNPFPGLSKILHNGYHLERDSYAHRCSDYWRVLCLLLCEREHRTFEEQYCAIDGCARSGSFRRDDAAGTQHATECTWAVRTDEVLLRSPRPLFIKRFALKPVQKSTSYVAFLRQVTLEIAIMHQVASFSQETHTSDGYSASLPQIFPQHKVVRTWIDPLCGDIPCDRSDCKLCPNAYCYIAVPLVPIYNEMVKRMMPAAEGACPDRDATYERRAVIAETEWFPAMAVVENVEQMRRRAIAPRGGVARAIAFGVLAEQLLRSLAVLHTVGVVHRDVKHENVLVYRHIPDTESFGSGSMDGNVPPVLVQLIDYGHARWVHGDSFRWSEKRINGRAVEVPSDSWHLNPLVNLVNMAQGASDMEDAHQDVLGALEGAHVVVGKVRDGVVMMSRAVEMSRDIGTRGLYIVPEGMTSADGAATFVARVKGALKSDSVGAGWLLFYTMFKTYPRFPVEKDCKEPECIDHLQQWLRGMEAWTILPLDNIHDSRNFYDEEVREREWALPYFRQFFNLILQLVALDPAERVLPVDALRDPFFKTLHSVMAQEGMASGAGPAAPAPAEALAAEQIPADHDAAPMDVDGQIEGDTLPWLSQGGFDGDTDTLITPPPP